MTCRRWCTDHIAEYDICVAPDIVLDFGDNGEHPITCHRAVVDLTQTDRSTTSVLHIGDAPVADLDHDQAAAIAWALLSQISRAKGDDAAADYYLGLAEQCAAAATVRSPR